MNRPLDGQRVILSGGLGDIGRATAIELARRGADIAIGDRRPVAEADGLLAELHAIGVRYRYDRVDVSNESDVEAWVTAAEEDLGTLTLVVPNAAIVTLRSSRDVSAAEWQRELSINLNGAFYLARSCANRLVAARRPGKIVFVGSWAAHAPHPSIVAYSVAKAGLRMLCRCMAVEYAKDGILVNEVAPGYVDAGLTRSIFDLKPGSREAAAQQVPTGQLIDATDVAIQIANLCDPAHRHTTGSVLLMDGGLSLRGRGVEESGDV